MTAGVSKQSRIVSYMAGSLRRRWRKNLVVTVVYALVIFALASVVLLTQALTEEAASALQEAPEITVQRMTAGRHGLMPVGAAAPLERIVGVRSARSRLWAYHADPDAGGLLLLRVPEGGGPGEREATAGEGVLRRRGIPVGGELRLRDAEGAPVALTVSGIARTATPLESAAVVNVSEATFRAMTGMPEGQATDLALRVRNRRELTTVASKIARDRPDARPILRDELARTYASAFNWRSGVIIAFLLVPVLAFILFAWDKAAGLGPDERREIGVLKAVGWDTGDVILLKFYEAAAVSLSAFALGVGLALGLPALSRPVSALPALLGWSTLYPSLRPQPVLGLYQVAMLFFLAVFPYLAATVVPAWRTATTDPDLVMRG